MLSNALLQDDSFDAVLSIAVIHHIATTERRVRALRELARVSLDSSTHSALTRGALGEVVNLTKPMIESGLGGLDNG